MELTKDETIIAGNIFSTAIQKDIFGRDQNTFIESVINRELREKEEKEREKGAYEKEFKLYKEAKEAYESEKQRNTRFQEYLEECLLDDDIEAYNNASIEDF